MIWTMKSEAKEGDLRYRRAFLFWTKSIAGQTRFWERAAWVEQAIRSYDGELEWIPISWRDELPEVANGFAWRNLYKRFFNREIQKINL